jgi:hypothetical protein
MFEILRGTERILIIVTFLAMIFSFACDNKQKYTGLYRAGGDKLQRENVNTIELIENGQGIWRITNDEASFSWGIKGKEIRLHTKTGGIIKGVIKNNGIEIMLPNSQTVFFTKIQ